MLADAARGLGRRAVAACGLAGLLAACAGSEPPPAVPLTASEAAKVVARSVWGVVPEAPRYKKDLRPELVKGSAVAVAPGSLVVSCGLVGQRQEVGLVRLQKYYKARVEPRAPGAEVCTLDRTQAPLVPVAGTRRLGDLQADEPLFALVSRDGGGFVRVKGGLTGRRVGKTRFETSLELPAGPESAVLFDQFGNFLGLAVPGPIREVRPSGETNPSPPFPAASP